MLVGALPAPGYGDVEPFLDLLTPNGFGAHEDNNSGLPASDFPPVGLATLDFYVDVTSDDRWKHAGMVVQVANRLASIEYFLDPNGPVLTAPESAGSPSRHVSFVSLPLVAGREQRARFRVPANVAGGYDTPFVQADASRLNIAWFDEVGIEYTDDGFVGRVTIDVSELLADLGLGPDDLFLDHAGRPFPAVADIAFATGTWRNPTPLQRIDLTLYAIPEPASLALLLAGILTAAHRRRLT